MLFLYISYLAAAAGRRRGVAFLVLQISVDFEQFGFGQEAEALLLYSCE